MTHLNVRAVIFDMDGLVLDSESTYTRAWQEAAQGLGFSLSDDFVESLFGCHADEVAHRIARACGPGFNAALFFAKAEALWFEAIQTLGIPKMPGVMAFLETLNTMAIPYALATNSDRPYADACLRAAGLRSAFALTVTRDEVSAGKPEPDLFLEAAARLGRRPFECLVLEDSETGLEAARRAGIPAILIQRNDTIRATLSPLAHAAFRTLADFHDQAMPSGGLVSLPSSNG